MRRSCHSAFSDADGCGISAATARIRCISSWERIPMSHRHVRHCISRAEELCQLSCWFYYTSRRHHHSCLLRASRVVSKHEYIVIAVSDLFAASA
jgi:hypothetical protein